MVGRRSAAWTCSTRRTGAVRTGGTDDIACWFIDTDYDGESFFVRHAYFLYGGKDTKEGPYDKLKKALRAEIDEGEWSKLYSATSQPFDPPKSGKIAVKVINHYGDEVLKVYPVPAVKQAAARCVARVRPKNRTERPSRTSFLEYPPLNIDAIAAWSAESCIREAVVARGLSPGLVGLADTKAENEAASRWADFAFAYGD